jgi:Ca2+-binding EF-hand superfamily protein
MRVASVFAEFDDDADGFVDAAELAALLRSAADSASVEVLDAMEWDPYDATFASDDAELDPGATAVAALDADGDGRVSLEEFVAWWRGGCPLESSGARAHAADDQDARTIATQSAFSAGD